MLKKRISVLLILMMSLVFVVSGCGQNAEQQGQQPELKTLKLATTTSTEDSGLLDFILPEMEKDIGYKVDVIAVGTGQAIAMGEAGDVDVILVHSRAAEDQFVADGFGVDRKDVMYNDFLLIGPEDDPAQIKGETDIVKALATIAEGKGVFVSRGDESGTHKKELSLFKDAGVTVDTKYDWYVETGQGMGDTYRIADEMKAYTLIDRATYYANMDKYSLVSIVEGDKRMFNPYGVIPVNPEKYPNVDYEGATKFAEWLTSEKGQKMIGEFGKDKFGEPLFFPDAK